MIDTDIISATAHQRCSFIEAGRVGLRAAVVTSTSGGLAKKETFDALETLTPSMKDICARQGARLQLHSLEA